MPRTFDPAFETEKDSDDAEPFIAAAFRFSDVGGSDLWVVDHSLKAFGQPPVVDGDTFYPIVTSFGTMGSGFGRQVDGSIDLNQIEVEASNMPVIGPDWPDSVGLRLADHFPSELAAVPIDFYWCFREPGGTVLRAIATSGVTRIPRYGYKRAKLRVTSLMDKWLDRAMLVTVTPDLFTGINPIPEESRGKHVPIAIGDTWAEGDEDTIGGARIPCVRIEEGVPRARWIVCENPAAYPLKASPDGIGPVYWDGHKLNEENIAIEVSDDSDAVAFNVTDGSTNQEPFSGDFYNVWGQISSSSVISGGIKLGGDAAPGGGSEPIHVIQLVRFTRPVQLSAVAIVADYHHVPLTGNEFDRFPLVLGITDPETGLTGGGGGLTATVGSPCGDLNVYMVRSSAAALQNADYDYSLSRQAYFNMPLWRPQPGKWYAFVFYIEGYGQCGIPADSTTSWYNIALGDGIDADEFTPVETGTTYVMNDDGDVTPVAGSGLDMAIYGYELSRDVGLFIDSGNAGESDFGLWGVYATAVEPIGATAVAGITMWLKYRIPAGAPGGVAANLKGNMLVKLNELDGNANGPREIASAEFRAADYDGKLNALTYTPAFEPFDETVLLEEGKRYEIRLSGKFDAEGQYQGWITQGVSFYTLKSYPADVPWTGPTNVGVYEYGQVPQPAKLAPVYDSENVSLRMTLHAVKFDRVEQDSTNLPMRCGTIAPYLSPPEAIASMGELYYGARAQQVIEQGDWVPEGVQLAADVACVDSRPDQVFEGILNKAGVPDARIDLAGTFADAATHYSTTYKLRGAVTEQQTYKQFLTRAAFEMRSEFDWEADKAQLKWLPRPDDTVTPVRTLSLADMKRVSREDPTPRVEIEWTEPTDVINLVRMLYRKNYSESGAYFDAVERRHAASIAARGELTRDDLFEMLYVRDVEVARAVAEFYLAWQHRERRTPILWTDLRTLELMKVDVIGLDLEPHLTSDTPPAPLNYDEGGYSEGGYSGVTAVFDGISSTLDAGATKFLLRAIQQNWPAREVGLIAVEMDR